MSNILIGSILVITVIVIIAIIAIVIKITSDSDFNVCDFPVIADTNFCKVIDVIDDTVNPTNCAGNIYYNLNKDACDALNTQASEQCLALDADGNHTVPPVPGTTPFIGSDGQCKYCPPGYVPSRLDDTGNQACKNFTPPIKNARFKSGSGNIIRGCTCPNGYKRNHGTICSNASGCVESGAFRGPAKTSWWTCPAGFEQNKLLSTVPTPASILAFTQRGCINRQGLGDSYVPVAGSYAPL